MPPSAPGTHLIFMRDCPPPPGQHALLARSPNPQGPRFPSPEVPPGHSAHDLHLEPWLTGYWCACPLTHYLCLCFNFSRKREETMMSQHKEKSRCYLHRAAVLVIILMQLPTNTQQLDSAPGKVSGRFSWKQGAHDPLSPLTAEVSVSGPRDVADSWEGVGWS